MYHPQVYFSSGAYVRTDAYEWGINIYIQSPAKDNTDQSLRGLCVGSTLGIIDHRVENGGSLVPEELIAVPAELR